MKTGSPTGADFIKAVYPKAKEVSQKTGIALELILAQAAVKTLTLQVLDLQIRVDG